MGPLARLGVVFRRGFGRATPDPFVLAVGLSLIVMLAALGLGDWPALTAEHGGQPPSWAAKIGATLDTWAGTGLWKLLGFAMQMVLMLVLGSALAEAPPVRRAIASMARLATGPRTLVAVTAFVSIALGLLSWSLSLIGGAVLAREAGRRADRAGWRLHYPIVCAAAYSGLMCWHGGMSGTAPLKATTEKDMLEVLGPELLEQVGTLGLDQTLFGPLNLFVSGGLLVLGPLVFALLTPRDGEDPAPEDPPAQVREPATTTGAPSGADQAAVADLADQAERGTLDRVERSPFVVWALAVPMLAALVAKLGRDGAANLDIDTVNLGLWVLALLLHGNPRSFMDACAAGLRSCTGIVLQFPLYAAIMALMAASGLSARLTTMVSSAGPGLLAPVTFLSAGLLNLLVPSGGGQWAVQGPIIMQAAVDTGVSPASVLMAMAYGDQWTNMLQPFWALPLLAMTGVRARDIVGYTVLWMLLGGVWIVAGLWLFV